MGLFLTLLYILTAYLGPSTLWGPLAEFRIELILAVLALIASLPALGRSKLFSIPQSYALLGMGVAVLCSQVMTGWLGSIVPAMMLGFIPNACTFYLVTVNCRKKSHLQMLAFIMFLFCGYSIFKGWYALHTSDYLSPYLMAQGGEAGENGVLYRLRGLAFINDPNDFSQVMVSLIPCMFFFWKKGSLPRNFLLVILPVSWLVFGMFLTHSRGGMLALLAVVLFGVRRKIGTVPSVILAGCLFAVTVAIGWSGGRDVSLEAGADRLEAWSVGLELIKSHPLFGVGFARFSDFYTITAHNTIVVCTAELGVFGLFWWVAFVLPTIRDALVSSQPNRPLAPEEDDSFSFDRAMGPRRNGGQSSQAASLTRPGAGLGSGLGWRDPRYAATGGMASSVMVAEELQELQPPQDALEKPVALPMHLAALEEVEQFPEPEEIARIAMLMFTCVVGYFVAGWFLSRAYIMTLFIYGGMVQSVYRMALARGIAAPRLKTVKIAQYSAITSIALIILVYVMLRIQHLTGG